jgi:uncharacterized protein YdcH (DUF465 family)
MTTGNAENGTGGAGSTGTGTGGAGTGTNASGGASGAGTGTSGTGTNTNSTVEFKIGDTVFADAAAMVAYANTLAADAKTAFTARETAKAEKKKAEEDALKEKGEYKTLFEQLQAEFDALKGTVGEYEGSVKGLLEAEKNGMKKEHLELVDSSLPVAKQLDFVRKLKTTLGLGNPGNLNASTPGDKGTASGYQADLDAAKTQKELEAVLKKYGKM